MIIETPSGYKVHLREVLTFGQKRQLQRALLAGMKISPENVKGTTMTVQGMESTTALDVEEKAFEVLCDKIEAGDQVILADFWATVSAWSEADGQVVFDAVDKIIFPKNDSADKKKVTT